MTGSLCTTTTRSSVARRRLITARGPAVAIIAAAVACFAVMAAWVYDTRDPKAVDTVVRDWLMNHVGSFVQQATLLVTDPVLTVGTCATVALVSLLSKRWDVAALAVIGPLAGLFLESYVLKPSIDRLFGPAALLAQSGGKLQYAFPSGHQTGVTSATILLTLLVLRTAWSRRVKTVSIVALVLWTVVAALALVRSDYHYFTDTVAGILLGVTVMLVTALALDVIAAKLSSPAGRGRPRTVPAA